MCGSMWTASDAQDQVTSFGGTRPADSGCMENGLYI